MADQKSNSESRRSGGKGGNKNGRRGEGEAKGGNCIPVQLMQRKHKMCKG